MVFPIVGGDGKPTGYEISNSLRFNNADNVVLAYTPSSSSSDANKRKYTFSLWVKRSDLGREQGMINWGKQTGAEDFELFFDSDDTIRVFDYGDDFGGSGFNYDKKTDAEFRDPSAWYHIFVRVDTTDGTAGDRVQLYVNGVRITSFSSSTDPSQNYAGFVGSADVCDIGTAENKTIRTLGAYLSEVHYIDGTAKEYTDFGEFNDNGVWIPKEYTGSYGTNGWFLEFQQTGTGTNSSGMGADTSGNDNHFAPSNLAATDVTVDTPTNNFAVFRAHGFPQNSKNVLSEGNTDFDFTGDGSGSARNLDNHCISNIGVVNGKWYAEFKHTEDANGGFVGVSNMSNKIQTAEIESYAYIYTNDSQLYFREKTGASESNTNHGGSSNSLNDIYQVALDMDNNNVYFGKNGSWASGSGAWNQSNPTSARSLSSDFINTDSHGVVVFNCAGAGSSTTPRFQANFGNAPFSISSGNADANGYGNFEYSVPSGYYSLCTKNLAEYG